jgi:starvation-inducible DNA-binding protein
MNMKAHQQTLKSNKTQAFGTVISQASIGLDTSVRKEVCAALNLLLADTLTLRDLYKKSHWQVTGPTFYPLHLLFDKHFGEQAEIVDTLAERIQTLGGVSVAMAADVAEMTRIPRAPKGSEPPVAQIQRLLHAHAIIVVEARTAAHRAAELGDDGTNDLLVGDVVRPNEMQVWFLREHLAG